MLANLEDTIAAIGSPAGAAARGMVRLSGPQALECVAGCFTPHDEHAVFAAAKTAHRIAGSLQIRAIDRSIGCDVFLWPTGRSFTGQRAAEIHTIGSAPILEAVLQTVCTLGARVAEPGEFTLRAFLAGRLDLTQAEAVLGVIDASSQDELQTALQQLAGGLSGPLAALREQLLQLLARLEAGLDFVEEDIEFVSPEQVTRELEDASAVVAGMIDQLDARSNLRGLRRVALVGPANAGKSSLFNALTSHVGPPEAVSPALVSDVAGTTRDYLAAQLEIGGHRVELVDTAGVVSHTEQQTIEHAAQQFADLQKRQVDLQVHCIDGSHSDASLQAAAMRKGSIAGRSCIAVTKGDLMPAPIPLPADAVVCSSVDRSGLDDLCRLIGHLLSQQQMGEARALASTAARCGDSLVRAGRSLQAAADVARCAGGDELVAAETRLALQELGRVVGVVYTDDVLDRIFSQFCIGK